MEIFAWDKYGGFGKATRLIGRELVKKGIEVFAVVPRRKNQREFEILDGIKIFGFPKYNPLASLRFFKECNADIFHSEEPSLTTYFALKGMPDRIHLVTSRDPRFTSDWIREFIHPSFNKAQVLANYLFEDNFLVKKSVRKANQVFSAARFLNGSVSKKYSLKSEVEFLPTPIEVPQREIKKSDVPTVCFLARWDKRKRPEIFFELAESFPGVNFIAVGKGRNNKYDSYLRKRYSHLKNLTMTGFINQFESVTISDILEKSWILINTATREGLPNSFLEALAYKCAILSSLNPENVTGRFGYLVENNDYKEGLFNLIKNDNWKTKGEEGQKYIKENYEFNSSVEKHISIYKKLLNNYS
jgi:glycosyltransferase involved in cell wall biosynthesis